MRTSVAGEHVTPGQEHGAVELVLAPDAHLVTDARRKPSNATASPTRQHLEQHEQEEGALAPGATRARSTVASGAWVEEIVAGRKLYSQLSMAEMVSTNWGFGGDEDDKKSAASGS
jgi:hypothetical protein